MVFCKNCKYICKPSGALYSPHPQSLCLISEMIDFVTGKTYKALCKDINIHGKCVLLTIKND